jgi:hypothetical protein
MPMERAPVIYWVGAGWSQEPFGHFGEEQNLLLLLAVKFQIVQPIVQRVWLPSCVLF